MFRLMLLNEHTNYGYPCCLDCVELEFALDSLPVIALVSLKYNYSSERSKNVMFLLSERYGNEFSLKLSKHGLSLFRFRSCQAHFYSWKERMFFKSLYYCS